ncbi:MAG: hypothetical protein ABFE08_05920 [Armatimonadia bacterium]
MPLFLILLLALLPSFSFGAEKPVPVKLTNPGFEEGAEPWVDPTDAALAAIAKRDTEAFRTGKAALHLVASGPGQYPTVSQKVEAIEPGARYALRVWYRGVLQDPSCAVLRLEFNDAQGAVLSGQHIRQLAKEERWLQLIVEAEAPEKAVSGTISLRLVGGSEVWFDDVEMLRTRTAPALVGKPARLAFPAGTDGTVALTVTSREDLPESVKPVVTAMGPNAKPVPLTGELTRQDARTLSGEVAFKALPEGTTVWRVKVGANTAEGRLFGVRVKRQPTSLNERGVLQVAGKTVFPIGIYHAAVSDYPLLYERGFNVVQGLGTNDATLARSAMAAADKAKLLVDVPLHFGGLVGANLMASQQKIGAFSKSTSILEWKIADEPDQREPIMDEVPEVYLRLKQKETLRPLGLTVADPATFGYWANFCDTLTVPVFPIPGRPLSLVAERIGAAKKAVQPWQPVWALLQAGWVPGNSNQPSLQQARVMVYLAVISGARGIFWYALRDPGWQLVESPLWTNLKDLNEETARLGEISIERDPVAIEKDNQQVYAAAWAAGEKFTMMVTNAGETAQTATVKLPRAVTKAEAGKSGVKAEVKDGAVVLTVESLGAGLVTVE